MYWNIDIDWDKDGTYTAEAARLLEVRTNRGRTRMMNANGMEMMRAGEVYLVLDNYDGRYDPYNTGSPLSGYVKPGRPLRLQAVEGSSTRPAFTGYVSDVRPEGGRDNRAVIKATDGLAFLERQNCQAVTPQSNYAVSDAIEDLLAQAEWPFVSSVTTFPFIWPLTLGSTAVENNGDTIDSWDVDTSVDLLTTLQDISEAFWGTIYATNTGSLAYRTRDANRQTAMTLEQSEVLTDIETWMPWDEIFNDLRVTPTVGAEQVVSDTASIVEYSRRTISITGNDYIQSAAQAGNLVDYLALYAPELKRGLRVRLQGQFSDQFAADLTDRVQVTLAALGVDGLYQVGQIEHYWRAGQACITTYRLEPDYYDVAGLQTFPFTWPLTLGWGGGA